MLLDRVYKPKEDDILYHYCDANAFLSICTSGKIRFGDLFSMNDFMEMHWGYSVWEEAATELLDVVGREFLDEIDKIIHSSGMKGVLTASCFSLSGDVLRQWRAYADDGQGYAIGFSAKDLIEAPVRPLSVLYNHEKQVHEMKSIILSLFKVEQQEEIKFGGDFWEVCTRIAFDLSSFKNPAFAEEQEVRLVHLLSLVEGQSFFKLTDDGGTAFGQPAAGEPIQFKIRHNTPTPFIDLDYTNKGIINPIKEVILGPKNDSLPTGVAVFLETVGIGSVRILKSKASYR